MLINRTHDYMAWTVREAELKAEKEDLEVIHGDPWHLLLDFDDVDEPPAQYVEGLEILNGNGLYCHEESRWKSKSGHGLHVVVKLDSEPIDSVKRLALQAMLGSDPKREMLGLLMTYVDIDEPSMLFKPKGNKANE